MLIIKTVAETRAKLNEFKAAGLKTGFVPTMGALHAGHLSLVQRAKAENDVAIVSIFVNPTQFNNPDDLKKYPRMPEKDFVLLEKMHTDIAFYPEVSEMYPAGVEKSSGLDFGQLDKVLEGKFRPGHFEGVAMVVSRLFEIIDADKAYFGEKDFQQLAVIRELVRQKKFGVEIIGCPTVREPDGLAMSSRNLLLNSEMRKEATKISQALFYVRDNSREVPFPELQQEAIRMIEESGKLKVEYLEIADSKTLLPVSRWNASASARCLTAVQAGNIRLIDNVQL
jgi:pantoate--beta-alanine ligase